jgi:hypothetical protein
VSEPGRFLGRIVAALDAAGVPHMLAGSYASGIHGIPRSTQDIDLVIDPTFESLDRLLALLGGQDLYFDADVAREEPGAVQRDRHGGLPRECRRQLAHVATWKRQSGNHAGNELQPDQRFIVISTV